nr:30s ribosomal protein s16-2, chloroplastic/mitochondrial [Quercus suber]
MVVRIRLSRFGCKNKPFYRVMAADSRSPRDGKHLEVLGYYNPLPGQDGGKRMGLNFERVKYWLSVGAQPSEPVQRVLFRAGLLPPPPMMAMGRKGGPRDTRPIDPMTGRILTPEKPANADQSNDSKGEEDGGAGIKNFCFYLDIPQNDSVVLHSCLTLDNKSHLFWEGCKLCGDISTFNSTTPH